MDIAIIGGGIAGLALALNLHQRGIPCEVWEAAPEVKELGVGITLLPHGMRELTALGLGETLLRLGIENRESAFFNRFGQLIYKEKRGRFAGYETPEVGIHRGRLHRALYEAVLERLGAERVHLGQRLTGLEQAAEGATLHFRDAAGAQRTVRAGVVVACDGVNSAVRRHFHPEEEVVFTGINTWRGVTIRKPILDGRTYIRVGSLRTGKIVIYPIVDDVDGRGNQLINWTTELQSDTAPRNDWNKPGRVEDFIGVFESWRFDWLDVPEMIRAAERIFEYPMVDKDPIERWTHGHVTLAGDAAHPMYPRGSNGSAQALIDVRVLADLLAKESTPEAALRAYEAARTGPTARVVRTNRENPPDIINIRVEELTGDKPFEDLDAVISQAELKELSDSYKRVAGFDLGSLSAGR